MINRIFLSGRLADDPVGKAVGENYKANFAIGVDGAYNSQSKRMERQFIDCVAWDRGKYKPASWVVDKCRKGDLICVEGKFIKRSYINKDGDKRYIHEVLCDEIDYPAVARVNMDEGRPDFLPLGGTEVENYEPSGDLPF
jgi:single-strand DNA-binding protein